MPHMWVGLGTFGLFPKHANLEASVKLFALDTEATSLDRIECELMDLLFSMKPNGTVYISLGH